MQLKNKAAAEKWIGAGERELRQLESSLTCRSGSSLLDLLQVLPPHLLAPADLAGLTFAELAKATNGFAERNLIGRGGFGAIYRGVLADGSMVAVKKMLDPDLDRNLVPLRGCCIADDDIEEGKQRFLVYDFMPNSALEDFIYRNKEAAASRTCITARCARVADFGYRTGTASCSAKPEASSAPRRRSVVRWPHSSLLYCCKLDGFGNTC